jgi:hypothetical protein
MLARALLDSRLFDRRLFAGFMIAACVLVTVGCSGRHSTSALAKILAVDDDASADSATAATTARSLRPGQFFSRGQMLRLSPGKKATVAFTPGIMITVFNQAEIKIDRFVVAKDGNETGYDAMERDVQINLTGGSLIAALAADALRSRFLITTRHGTLSTESGSLFYLDDSAERLRVTCVRGTVRLGTGPHGGMTIFSGQWIAWRAGSQSEPRTVSTDPRAQEDVTQALEAETAMQALLLAEQKIVPSWRHP